MPGEAPAPPALLERDEQLEALDAHLAAAARGTGRLVLLAGEAGIGKTVLVRRFCEDRRFLWGVCDPLFTPRPLGPLADIAAQTGGALEELVESGHEPYEIAAALLAELRRRSPTIVVVEDLHWADAATLDVLSVAARRIESAPALVVATFRDDELGPAHPLRIVLGELTAAHRLRLAPLSLAGVRQLAEPRGIDPEELHLKTGGNPFYVTEVLAEPAPDVPATVRDAVLARAARLSASARRLLEALAIVPQTVEPWLLDAIAGEDAGDLEKCLASGTLLEERGGVAFRHELARIAIEESVSPRRRKELHQRALSALRLRAPDPARLAHHAEAAGDANAVLEFAPAAAERASRAHAHREAAAQYARALRSAGGLPLERRARLLESLADELQITDAVDEALAARRSALACYRELADRRKVGVQLQRMCSLLRHVGRPNEAEAAAAESVEVLEGLPAGPELAEAYSQLAYLAMLADDVAQVAAWGRKAIEIAERCGRPEIVADALATVGASEAYTGASEGLVKLERALALARQTGRGVARTLGVLVAAAAWLRRLDLADRYLAEGLAYTREHELYAWRNWLLGWQALLDLQRGRWSEAGERASLMLSLPRLAEDRRLFPLVALGRLRARRGDPEKWPPLDEAHTAAAGSRQLQRLVLVASSRAEAFWLEGASGDIAEATDDAFEMALRLHDPWAIGELAIWRWRAGLLDEPPSGAAEPYALEIAGGWERAAELWREIGCPYEAALALAGSDDEEALRRSLSELQRLGARPAAAVVSRRLRERGARGLRRGPRPATRQNPAGLTARELDVLALLTQGLPNAEIAEKLFLSPKTVGHHVSAILHKLDARTRAQATAEAVRLGIAELPK